MQASPILAVSIAVLLAPSRPAEACTCAPVPPVVSPRDGAIDVPTDAVVLVATGLNVPKIELVGPAGARVPLSLETHARQTDAGAWVKAVPAELAPSTSYELVVEWAYGTQRTHFTTGVACEPESIEFEGLRAMAAETMTYPVLRADGHPCFDPCVDHSGHVSRLRLDFDRPPGAALVVLELTGADGKVVDNFALPERTGDDYVLGFQSCEVRSPELDPGANYCGRITAYDVRGTAVGGDAVVCTTAATCAPKLSGFACIPSDACDAELPVIEESVETAEASNGCSSSNAAGGLLAILVPALLPRRLRRRST